MNNKNLFTQLNSGIQFFPWQPTPEMIDIEDIIHSLPRLNRYLGHTVTPLSVAQHCCAMALAAPHGYKFECLMHDAAEAYIGDMPYPVKAGIPQFKALEDKIWREAIAPRYHLPKEMSDVVHRIDREMIAYEYELFMSDEVKESGIKWDFHGKELEWADTPIKSLLIPMDEWTARILFTNFFKLLAFEWQIDEKQADRLQDDLIEVASSLTGGEL